MANKKIDDRYRLWATIIYEESAKPNWREYLSEQAIPCFISPYHDKDFTPEGEPKKPHYHILFSFEGKKSLAQVKKHVEAIGGVGCLVRDSLRGSARYLCHLDNPEKALYNEKDVVCYGGLDYFEAISTVMDRYVALREMISYVEEHTILYFCDLYAYATFNNFVWFRLLSDSCAIPMREYIRSKKDKHERQLQRKSNFAKVQLEFNGLNQD